MIITWFSKASDFKHFRISKSFKLLPPESHFPYLYMSIALSTFRPTHEVCKLRGRFFMKNLPHKTDWSGAELCRGRQRASSGLGTCALCNCATGNIESTKWKRSFIGATERYYGIYWEILMKIEAYPSRYSNQNLKMFCACALRILAAFLT